MHTDFRAHSPPGVLSHRKLLSQPWVLRIWTHSRHVASSLVKHCTPSLRQCPGSHPVPRPWGQLQVSASVRTQRAAPTDQRPALRRAALKLFFKTRAWTSRHVENPSVLQGGSHVADYRCKSLSGLENMPVHRQPEELEGERTRLRDTASRTHALTHALYPTDKEPGQKVG